MKKSVFFVVLTVLAVIAVSATLLNSSVFASGSVPEAQVIPLKGPARAGGSVVVITPAPPATAAAPVPTPTLNLSTVYGQEQTWLNSLAYGTNWVINSRSELYVVEKILAGVDCYYFYNAALINQPLAKPIVDPADSTKKIWTEPRYVKNMQLSRDAFFSWFGFFNYGVDATALQEKPLVINMDSFVVPTTTP